MGLGEVKKIPPTYNKSDRGGNAFKWNDLAF